LVALDLTLPTGLPNIDPAIAVSGPQFDLVENLFVGLTNYNHATNTIEPELAEGWEVSDNGRTWTFALRDDIFWIRPTSTLDRNSGLLAADPIRPVVADDVVYAVQRICDRESETPYAFILFIIDGCQAVYTLAEATAADLARIGIRAVDATTLEISLTKPAGYLLTMSSMWLFSPVPRDLATELGAEWLTDAGLPSNGWQTPDNLLTSGPFMPVSMEPNAERIVLHRNPLWPISRNGNADMVNLLFVEDELESFALWQERNLDVARLPASEREAFLERTPEKVQLIPDQTLFYLGFNFESQVFREPALRQAFSAAIDRESLIDGITAGEGLPMRHFTPPGIFAAPEVDEVGIGYSPDYARQQLANSTVQDCRLMSDIVFLVSSIDFSLRQAELIRDMWEDELQCPEEIITIEQVPFGALLANTRPEAGGARPDLWELAWAPYFPDAHNLLSDLLHCQDGDNRQLRPCDEVDTLIRNAGAAVDPAERQALYREVENRLFGESGLFPIVPLYVRVETQVVQSWLTFTPAAFGGEQYDTYVVDTLTKELERSR
jgi:oligopeptide transport system substrate-binding protein